MTDYRIAHAAFEAIPTVQDSRDGTPPSSRLSRATKTYT
jgi:hypothetical protein